MRWLFKCGAGALVVLLACALATARFGHRLQLPATTARDGALVTLNRYVDEPVPDVVLVGSSLTFRLSEAYFATPRVRNLALAGGSPVTGLEIVANQQKLPRIVLVETNVLSRGVDEALVERFSADGHRQPLLSRPIRTAIAAYENFVHAPVAHAEIEPELRRLLDAPPDDFDNRVYVERAISVMDAEDPTAEADANVQRIARLIGSLEQRGTRVFLIELPLAPQVRQTRSARVTRDIVHRAFPDSGRWLDIRLDAKDLRWADGVHLDERSAILVVRYLDTALAAILPHD
jgi:hypothetical protein